MLEEEDYGSDSDQSDEDYKPDAKDAEQVSEEESDGEPEDHETGSTSTSRPRKRKSASASKEEPEVKKLAADNEDKEEESKAHAEALWADFLSGTDAPPPAPKALRSATITSPKEEPKPAEKKPPAEAVKKQTIKEIFEFAGEAVEVEKEVTVPVVAGNGASPSSEALAKRPRTSTSGGGLNAILGQIGKKNKLSILEKTKLDWSGFKKNEGIDEELQIHNKGRGGFLERQDFLERTDLRQFEIEKSLRQSNRKK